MTCFMIYYNAESLILPTGLLILAFLFNEFYQEPLNAEEIQSFDHPLYEYLKKK